MRISNSCWSNYDLQPGPSVSDTAADNMDHGDDLQNDATIMHLKVYHSQTYSYELNLDRGILS